MKRYGFCPQRVDNLHEEVRNMHGKLSNSIGINTKCQERLRHWATKVHGRCRLGWDGHRKLLEEVGSDPLLRRGAGGKEAGTTMWGDAMGKGRKKSGSGGCCLFSREQITA